MSKIISRLKIIVFLLAVHIALFSYPPKTFSQNSEDDVFIVAQKAFEDGFYDVAIRYIEQLLNDFPQTQKRVQAQLLLGQCYFFQSQYLKAYDIFNGLLSYNEYKDVTLFWLGETYLKGADYKQAENYYKQLIDLFPKSDYAPQAIYSLGWVYFEQNQFEKAKTYFEELIKKYPQNELLEDSTFKMGECLYNLKDYEKTIEFFNDYLTKFPKTTRQSDIFFYIAESYYYQNDYLTAVTYYAKTADIAYDQRLKFMSKVSLGWCYLKLEKFDLSETNFQDALKFAQDKGILTDDVYLGQANLYTEMEQYDKALDAYDNLIQNFPKSARIADSYQGKANIYYQQQKYPQAIKNYQSVIDQFKDNPLYKEVIEKAYFGMAWSYLKSGDIDVCVKTFEQVKNQASSVTVKISALTQIADAYQDAGQLEKAISVYDEVLRDYPDSAYTDYVQYRQGIALLKLDRIESATLAFQTLKSNFPESKYLIDTDYYMAVAYFKKSNWALAKDYCENFISQPGASQELLLEAYYILGLSYYNLADFNQSLTTFQAIIEKFPQESTMIRIAELNIAKCYYSMKQAPEALKKFKAIVLQNPKTQEAQESLIWLGDHYMQSEDFADAINYYQQFADSFPGSDQIDLIYYQLGQALESTQQYDKAINVLQKIDSKRNHLIYAKARLAIADIFSKDLDPLAAVKTYENIIQDTPDLKRDAYTKIADIYKKNQDYTHALESYQNALISKTESSLFSDAQIQFSIADTYELLNTPQKAIDAYMKIPYLYPDQKMLILKAYLRAGRIFEDQESWADAKTIYQKIVDLKTGESKFAQERLDWINNHTLQ